LATEEEASRVDCLGHVATGVAAQVEDEAGRALGECFVSVGAKVGGSALRELDEAQIGDVRAWHEGPARGREIELLAGHGELELFSGRRAHDVDDYLRALGTTDLG